MRQSPIGAASPGLDFVGFTRNIRQAYDFLVTPGEQLGTKLFTGGMTMITKRLSIMLGVATATVGVALLVPVSSATAGGGGTHGALPTGPNQNPNAGNSGNGSGSQNGSFPTGPNQNPNGGSSSSGSGGSTGGNGGRTPPGGHGLGAPGSGSGSGSGRPGGGGPSGGGARPGQ